MQNKKTVNFAEFLEDFQKAFVSPKPIVHPVETAIKGVANKIKDIATEGAKKIPGIANDLNSVVREGAANIPGGSMNVAGAKLRDQAVEHGMASSKGGGIINHGKLFGVKPSDKRMLSDIQHAVGHPDPNIRAQYLAKIKTSTHPHAQAIYDKVSKDMAESLPRKARLGRAAAVAGGLALAGYGISKLIKNRKQAKQMKNEKMIKRGQNAGDTSDHGATYDKADRSTLIKKIAPYAGTAAVSGTLGYMIGRKKAKKQQKEGQDMSTEETIAKSMFLEELTNFALDYVKAAELSLAGSDLESVILHVYNKSFQDYLIDREIEKQRAAKVAIKRILDDFYNGQYMKSEVGKSPMSPEELNAPVAESDKNDTAVMKKYKQGNTPPRDGKEVMNEVARERKMETKKQAASEDMNIMYIYKAAMADKDIDTILTLHPAHILAHELDESGLMFDWSKCDPGLFDTEFIPREVIQEITTHHGINYFPHEHVPSDVMNPMGYSKSENNLLETEFSQMHELLHKADHSAYVKGIMSGNHPIHQMLENGGHLNASGSVISPDLLEHFAKSHGENYDGHMLELPIIKAYSTTLESALGGANVADFFVKGLGSLVGHAVEGAGAAMGRAGVKGAVKMGVRAGEKGVMAGLRKVGVKASEGLAKMGSKVMGAGEHIAQQGLRTTAKEAMGAAAKGAKNLASKVGKGALAAAKADPVGAGFLGLTAGQMALDAAHRKGEE